MFDINLVRENPKLVKDNLKKKFKEDLIPIVDDLLAKDKEWKELKKQSDDLRAKRNTISLKINQLKKAGKKADSEIQEASAVPRLIKELEERISKLEYGIKHYLMDLPNMMDKNVPIGEDASKNIVKRKWGKIKKYDFELKGHGELAEELGIADFQKSTKVSGAGFYYLKNELGILNQSLIRFAIDHMMKKGYTYVEPPLMLRKSAYEGVVDMEDFEKVMYKVDNEDLYFIATSEHSLIAQYMNENIPIEQLPIKLVGYSMCFRKEIGSHGVDTRGLFRTHQFNKVEQIVLCKPEESWDFFDAMLKNTEDIMQALELPYQVLEICSGDLGPLKARSIDVEAWMPKQGAYKEVGSLTNCTDYQARRLDIKFADKKGNKQLVHTLNNTALATSRILVAIIENFQNKDGSIDIPKALHKYTGFTKIMPKKKFEKQSKEPNFSKCTLNENSKNNSYSKPSKKKAPEKKVHKK